MPTTAADGDRPPGGLKGVFPFRLGTTSYILPDDILPNVRFLADRVDDVELVLFESDEVANIPSPGLVRQLAEIGRRQQLGYTVHLPLDIHTGHTEEAERRRSVAKCLRVIERTAPLAPEAYLLHLAADRRGGVPADDLERWQDRHRRSVAELVRHAPAERLCVESLDYPLALVSGIVADLGLSICLDIGHLLCAGRDVLGHLDEYLERTRVIHLHGVHEGRDHAPVGHLAPTLLAGLLGRLARGAARRRVVTLEVFGEEDFSASMAAMAALAGGLSRVP